MGILLCYSTCLRLPSLRITTATMAAPNVKNGQLESAAFPFQVPSDGSRPQNVGIHAIEVYFPPTCIDEKDLETFDGVPAGKYTIGLGQEYMAYTDDREDINSFLLTVTSNLLEKYNIEGIDSKNACYGGTAALFNCINWVESKSWDGRYALMVAGDIAVYAEGASRPVGGAGAVAILIGPDAPMVFEPVHGNCMGNWWDFFKPELSSEYPSVDGPLTLHSYLGGLEQSYENFVVKETKRIRGGAKTNGQANGLAEGPAVSLKDFDYIGFHGPFGKMVQKGTARLAYMDYLLNPSAPEFANVDPAIRDMPRSKTLTDKAVEKQFVALSSETYKNKVWPSTQCVRRLGNMYTGAVYGALASIIDSVEPQELLNKRIALFSFGSGL